MKFLILCYQPRKNLQIGSVKHNRDPQNQPIELAWFAGFGGVQLSILVFVQVWYACIYVVCTTVVVMAEVVPLTKEDREALLGLRRER